MLFGYITDKKIVLDLVDLRTNKVFKSFRSETDYRKWSKHISPDLLADFTVKIRSVPWFEDNCELAKICLPVVIIIYLIIRSV